MTFRVVYSSRQDPVRTELADAPVEQAAGPIADQLAVLCRDAGGDRILYNNVGEFTRSLRD